MSPPVTWTSFLRWCGWAELPSRWTGESEPWHRYSFQTSVNTSRAWNLGHILKRREERGARGTLSGSEQNVFANEVCFHSHWLWLALDCDTTIHSLTLQPPRMFGNNRQIKDYCPITDWLYNIYSKNNMEIQYNAQKWTNYVQVILLLY